MDQEAMLGEGSHGVAVAQPRERPRFMSVICQWLWPSPPQKIVVPVIETPLDPPASPNTRWLTVRSLTVVSGREPFASNGPGPPVTIRDSYRSSRWPGIEVLMVTVVTGAIPMIGQQLHRCRCR